MFVIDLQAGQIVKTFNNFLSLSLSHHLSHGATETRQGMVLDWKADSGEAGQLVHVLGIKKQELAVWQKRL